jgi:hypothetical protein
MTPLAGALGLRFGVCCNELSADGQVVDFFYGCGAHSDTPAAKGTGSPAYEPFDDGVLEMVEVERAAVPAEAAAPGEACGATDSTGQQAEPNTIEPGSGPEAEAGSEPEPEPGSEPETGSETGSEAEAETGSETGSEAEAEAGSEAGS